MKTEIKEQIKKIKIPFETHCYQVLSNSTCGRNTSDGGIYNIDTH